MTLDRRKFLAQIGFAGVAPAMVDPIMKTLQARGIAPDVEALLEPIEKQQQLSKAEIIRIYKATLEDMGTHNEAIDRMTGRWMEMDERRLDILKKKKIHQANMDQLWAGRHGRRAAKRKHVIRRRIKDLRRTPKPRLP